MFGNSKKYLSNSFFEGKGIELVPRESTPGVLHVRIGDNTDDEPIDQLGDGIQSIIAILYPIFTQLSTEKHNIVGIEEPEMNLHPGMQRQLIEALNEIKHAQFFITTHSNHFLETLFDYDFHLSLQSLQKTAHNPKAKREDQRHQFYLYPQETDRS